jgi:hypothetical protein
VDCFYWYNRCVEYCGCAVLHLTTSFIL